MGALRRLRRPRQRRVVEHETELVIAILLENCLRSGEEGDDLLANLAGFVALYVGGDETARSREELGPERDTAKDAPPWP